MDSLTDAKRRKETEIDRICSRHYGDFLTSVSEMLKLRSEAKHLTSLVTDVHRKFKTTGGKVELQTVSRNHHSPSPSSIEQQLQVTL
jgi:hypothetical protein